MRGKIALLGLPGSPVTAAVAAALEAGGRGAVRLDLFAPLAGKPVTIASGRVTWEGCELSAAGAVLAEAPVFPWPQPGSLEGVLEDGVPARDRVRRDREGRSLVASALHVLAGERPVVNPPGAAHGAVAPAAVLDDLARHGLPVTPWRMDAAAPGTAGWVADAAGRDAWHQPARPPAAGEPALLFDAAADAAIVVLVAGNAVVAARRIPAGPLPADPGNGDPVPAEELPGRLAELAVRAAATVRAPVCALTVIAGEDSRVLFIETGPDLAAWHAAAGEGVAEGLARMLVSLADNPPEDNR